MYRDRSVQPATVAAKTGLMTIGGAMLGSVPMCHKAGDMAGHVAFGARTGRSPIILGTLLVCSALFLGDGIRLLFEVFPVPILGVALLIATFQMLLSVRKLAGSSRASTILMVGTVVMGLRNIVAALVSGIFLHHCIQRRMGDRTEHHM